MLCVSTKGGTGGDGWVHLKVQTAWPCLGSTLKRHWMGHFSPPIIICMIGLRKLSSHLIGPPFPALKVFCNLDG